VQAGLTWCDIGSAEPPRGQHQSWNGGWTETHGTANACDPGRDPRGGDVPRDSSQHHHLASGRGLDRGQTEPLRGEVWALFHPWMTERWWASCKGLWKWNAGKGEWKRGVREILSGEEDNPALASAWFICRVGKLPGSFRSSTQGAKKELADCRGPDLAAHRR
jgi:hypothetical protein